jgi:hypothetical protein
MAANLNPSEQAVHPEMIAVVKSMIEATPPPRGTRHRAGAFSFEVGTFPQTPA